ncbi:dipeptidase [Affinirhizobium pseudoryzae]|uniref:dipeptidase n=1 Tax=Allorhizobium pseudoryzae TaxID=379684 RepID=UPI0013EAF1A8|nr:dipeptidase [Allorhizobium pseudoryzae]
MLTTPIPVFDGHNDVLLRLRRGGGEDPVKRFLEGEEAGHIDLPRAKAGGLAGGLCAIYIPSPSMTKDANGDFPTPTQADALNETLAMARLLFDIEARSQGAVTICRSAADIRRSIEAGSFAAVVHIEGAEAVAADLDALYVLHQAGLRTLGPVWSRPNAFAYGVPFRYPSSPDIGPGLTDAGRDLIRACNELKIMVDLSHMNDAGFWDIAKISQAPLVASHSNVHALCPHSRNLTDRQLDSIKDTGGLVGINFGVLFLRDDGVKDAATSLDLLVRHVAYVADRIGIDRVALGSDFDGTTIPAEMKDAAGLPRLVEALRRHGFSDAELTKITHENWVSVLERTWGA